MKIRYFSAIVLAGKVPIRITTASPLTIGSGRRPLDPASPDIPQIRDALGRPVIPGSTLKGFFRTHISRFLYSQGIQNYYSIVRSIFGFTSREIRFASRVMFTDAYVQKETPILSRQHIKINPRTMGVEHGPFEQEYIPENTTFTAELHFRNMPLSLLALFSIVKSMAKLGIARLGRSKSRGYGKINLELGDLDFHIIGKGRSLKYELMLNQEIHVNIDILIENDKVKIKDNLMPEYIEGKYEVEAIGFKTKIMWNELENKLDMIIENLKSVI